jgi:hypothetical protein
MNYLKEKPLPQLNIAAFVHQLWIHETGLYIGVSQYHQATLQIHKKKVLEFMRRKWVQRKKNELSFVYGFIPPKV